MKNEESLEVGVSSYRGVRELVCLLDHRPDIQALLQQKEHKGTGLGLSTAIGIVRSHGSFINVYVKSTGYSIYDISAGGKSRQVCVRESDTPDLQQGKGELVLIVVDEAGIRREI